MPPSGDWEGLLFFTAAAIVTIGIDWLRRWVARKNDEEKYQQTRKHELEREEDERRHEGGAT